MSRKDARRPRPRKPHSSERLIADRVRELIEKRQRLRRADQKLREELNGLAVELLGERDRRRIRLGAGGVTLWRQRRARVNDERSLRTWIARDPAKRMDVLANHLRTSSILEVMEQLNADVPGVELVEDVRSRLVG